MEGERLRFVSGFSRIAGATKKRMSIQDAEKFLNHIDWRRPVGRVKFAGSGEPELPEGEGAFCPFGGYREVVDDHRARSRVHSGIALVVHADL
jgi:hypothetical protein